jgi:hypothetical protein
VYAIGFNIPLLMIVLVVVVVVGGEVSNVTPTNVNSGLVVAWL